jgi:hypothetical protein
VLLERKPRQPRTVWTARSIARHGVPKRAQLIVLSPYTKRECVVVDATEHGTHVTLICDDGATLLVDANYKLMRRGKRGEV